MTPGHPTAPPNPSLPGPPRAPLNPVMPAHPVAPANPVASAHPVASANLVALAHPIAPADPVPPANPVAPPWRLADPPSTRRRTSFATSYRAPWRRSQARSHGRRSTHDAVDSSIGPQQAVREDVRARRRPARSGGGFARSLGTLIVAGIVVVLLTRVDHALSGGHSTGSASHSRPPVSATRTGAATKAGSATATAPTVSHPSHSAPAAHHATTALAGVTMPNTGGGSLPLHPVRLLLIVEDPADLAKVDLATLGSWIRSHERPGSVVRLLSGGGAQKRLSAPLSPDQLSAPPATVASTAREAERWLRRRARAGVDNPTRLAVEVGEHPREPRVLGASSATITLRAKAPVPSATSANPARHDAITSALALQIIKATGQSETELPHLR